MNIDMAKELIKKGTELGDDELIAMGHELLCKYGGEEEKRAEVEQSVVHGYNYVCANCDHTFVSDRERKRCPQCNKHKLLLARETVDIDVQVDTEAAIDEMATVLEKKLKLQLAKRKQRVVEAKLADHRNTEDGLFNFNTRSQTRERINPDTGEQEGVYTRSEDVNPNRISAVGNLWDDDPSLFHEDTEAFTRKVRFQVSPRRPPSKKIQDKTCERCNKPMMVAKQHAKQYICDRCIMRGSTR